MSRADLEGRFVKRFSPRYFMMTLNYAEGLADAVYKELQDAVRDLIEEVAPSTSFGVNLDNEDAELAVTTAPGGRALHRSLYQLSKFFKWIPAVSVSKSKGLTLFEMLDATGATQPRTIEDLDPFNQYVLLHFLPYIRKAVSAGLSEEEEQGLEALNDVVIDKISCLRENSDENQ